MSQQSNNCAIAVIGIDIGKSVAAAAPTAIAATCEMIDKRKVDRQAAPALPEQLLSPILLALRAPRTEMRDMASIPRSRSKNRLE